MGLTRCSLVAVGLVVFAAMTSNGRRADAADPCSMLTADAAAAALGVPEVKASPGANRCIWTRKKYKKGAGDSVTLILMDKKGFDAYRALPVDREVSGIGTAALQNPRVPGILLVQKGNVYFSISVSGLPADQAAGAVASLAKQVTP